MFENTKRRILKQQLSLFRVDRKAVSLFNGNLTCLKKNDYHILAL